MKLDEDVAELNRTVAELTAETGEEAMQKLQEEIKDCKAILKCGVCLDRPKEVILSCALQNSCNLLNLSSWILMRTARKELYLIQYYFHILAYGGTYWNFGRL